MAFVKASGITFHYRLTGASDAPVVMFSNSLGTSFQTWDAVADLLAPDYRVLRYDMRGHGLTDAPPGPYAIEQLADDAAGLLDALDIDRVHFCGLSIGGMIGQQFGARHADRVRGLVLCDTGMRIGTAEMWQQRIDTARDHGIEPMAAAVLERWFTERFFRERADELDGYRNMLVRTPAEGYAAACEAIRDADLEAASRTIGAPTLVLVGDQDKSTPPELARDIVDTVPNARMEIIQGAGHIPCVEQPQALTARIKAFLREVGRG